MKIDLTKQEMETLIQLMDAGVRAAGLQAVKPEVLAVIEKLVAAQQEKQTDG
jgi:hypothetical protein